MADRRIACCPARPTSAADLSADAERLTAVLLALEHGTDPNHDLADALGENLRLALLYELLPHAIEMSRRLSVDLAGLDGGRA